ncbi:hypothetical protein Fcan01_16863 [Folsomia candida]|uniref:Uncharacterized protein n=1 Tax=Folsomia candida TaxID=158441 RepID=A0A226DSD7_FOLCA|nr:hypothetical protein Fcan01_16863 [Folsomia candida]
MKFPNVPKVVSAQLVGMVSKYLVILLLVASSTFVHAKVVLDNVIYDDRADCRRDGYGVTGCYVMGYNRDAACRDSFHAGSKFAGYLDDNDGCFLTHRFCCKS